MVVDDGMRERVSGLIHTLLETVGENPDREGLIETPRRVAKMYQEIFRGYDAAQAPNMTVFANDEGYNQMVLDEGYFYSLCEHHMVPFFGQAFVAYIPEKKIVGISKLGRIVDHYAARLQVQERLTNQIATFLQETLEPKGVGVVLHARHLCREMRGVKKQGAYMTTSAVLGEFHDDAETRAEFMSLVQSRLKT